MENPYTPFCEMPEILKNLNVGNYLKHILHIISTLGRSKLRSVHNAPFLLDAFTIVLCIYMPDVVTTYHEFHCYRSLVE